MAERIVVVGAALIQTDERGYPYLFTGRHIGMNSYPPYWEFVGGPVLKDDDEKEKQVINDVFQNDFGVEVRSDIKIGLDRDVVSWVDERGNSQDASLHVWRTQPAMAGAFNLASGEPKARYVNYDDSAWVSLEDLDAVAGSWRPEDRMTAEEIRNYYYGDDNWQLASRPYV